MKTKNPYKKIRLIILDYIYTDSRDNINNPNYNIDIFRVINRAAYDYYECTPVLTNPLEDLIFSATMIILDSGNNEKWRKMWMKRIKNILKDCNFNEIAKYLPKEDFLDLKFDLEQIKAF